MDRVTDRAAALADAARSIETAHSLPEMLAHIAAAALTSIPGFEHVGISTIEKGGRIDTRASTDQVVHALDDLQYSLGQGPCVDALRNAHVVMAENIREDHRWPTYVERAVAEHGLRSQLALKLFLDEQGTIGSLNLYSCEHDEIDPAAESVAEVFAAHAAAALGHVRQVDQLTRALETSRVIGIAVGVVMERHHLDRQRAFAFLAQASAHGNVKLRDVAQQMVAGAEAVSWAHPAD